MTNILKVQPELLDVLASHQHNAAASASSGVAATAGLAESVAISHGSYCKQFNDTLKMYESAHNAFGSSLHAAGIALAKICELLRVHTWMPMKPGVKPSSR
ncbi:EspC protein [Mycobacterium kansasii]|uniref:EspC protein n=1 Tax=Mycobacterium kansasii TaxID=1768 RepID=A0A7G1I1J8_MYCKA|nr:EspC protein [Mycobacterium kansasii]